MPPFRRLFRPARGPSLDEELDAELAFHLASRADALAAAGMEREAAWAEARRQFGDVEHIRRHCREIDHQREGRMRRAELLESVTQDLRYAARGLRRAPGFAVVAVLTLALGFGATTAIFSVVSAVLLRPLPYPGAERIVILAETGRARPAHGGSTSYLNWADWRARSRSLEATAIVDDWSPALTGGCPADGGACPPERLAAAIVTAGIFDVVGVRPALGRPILPADNVPGAENVVVVSHDFWARRLGGAPGALGRPITLNGRPFTVVGVLPAGFRGPADLDAPVWVNFGPDSTDTRSARYLSSMARLKPGVTLEAARAELGAISAQLEAEHPRENRGMVAVVTPLRDKLAGDTRVPLLLLLGASALVLLIACANLSNLLIARGVARSKEFALRVALGAGRARVTRQLLSESALLAALGAGLGLLLAHGATTGLLALAPAAVRESGVALDWRVLAFTLGATVLTALLVGLAPALRTTRVDVQATLKGSGGLIHQTLTRVRDALVVAQLALALTLLAGAGLLVKSFARLQRVDPGIDPSNVLTLAVNVPGAKYPAGTQPAFYEALLERVRALPGVRGAAVTSIVPFGTNWDRIGVEVEGVPRREGDEMPEGDRYIVSPDYFRAMGVRLLAGRTFAAADRYEHPPVAVVDEVFARKVWGAASPIGRRLKLPQRDSMATVIGVVAHVKHYGLDAESGGQIYMSHLQYPWRWMLLVVRAERDPTALVAPVRGTVRALDPDVPIFNVSTMAQLMADRTAVRRFILLLLGVFAGTAVVVAAVGLYGVIAYAVTQRRQEIGIRVALGARRADVLRMVVRHGALLAAAGALLGVVGALAGARLLSGLLFGVKASDPAVLGGVSLLLVAVALAASWLPARRAAAVSPMESLRGDG